MFSASKQGKERIIVFSKFFRSNGKSRAAQCGKFAKRDFQLCAATVDILEARTLLSVGYWNVQVDPTLYLALTGANYTGSASIIAAGTSTVARVNGTTAFVSADTWQDAVKSAITATARGYSYSGSPTRFSIGLASEIGAGTRRGSLSNVLIARNGFTGIDGNQKVVAFEDGTDWDYNDSYFAITSTKVTMTSLTVEDANDSQSTVTVNNETAMDLYIPQVQNADFSAIQLIPGYQPLDSELLKHLVWKVTGQNASPAGGTFEVGSGYGAMVGCNLTPSLGNRDFTVTAAVDANNNGQMDETPEFTVNVHVFTVTVASSTLLTSATTAWVGARFNLGEVAFTLSITPANLPDAVKDRITMSIGDINSNPYSPADDGTLVRDVNDKMKWWYVAPRESRDEKHPSDMFVAFDTYYDSDNISNSSNDFAVRVVPVFSYLGIAGPNADVWNYIAWKYPVVFQSGRNLSSISYAPAQTEMSLTSRFGGSVGSRPCTLGNQAFANENILASVIGHENVHGGQSGLVTNKLAETLAYGWEVANAIATGIDANYLSNVTSILSAL